MFAALPSAQVKWADPRLRGAWLAIAAAAIVAMVFLPKSFTNNDEYYYAGQAYTLTQGRITPRGGDPLLVPLQVPGRAFRYPVAWPAVLALGRLVSIRSMYVVVLCAHLLGAAAAARLLVRRGAQSLLCALYLFHPVFWIYSRTLLSDLPATAALLIAMDAWENRDRATAAGSLGFAGAARIANITVTLGFGLAVIQGVRRRLADFAGLVLGVSTFWAAQVVVNHTVGSYWLVSPYAKSAAVMLTGGMITENTLLYLGGLALLPPFSLLFAVARRHLVDRWAWIAVVVVVAHLPISWHNVSSNVLETLVGGQRYVMPAHAALLIATAGAWTGAPVLRRAWFPAAAGVAIAVGGCLAMARLENRHRVAAEAVAACHPSALAYNRYANRIAGSVQARSYIATEDIPGRDPNWDVLVLAPSFQSNQPGFSGGWSLGPPRIEGASCRQIGSYSVYDFTGHCPLRGDPCSFDRQR